MPEPSRAEDFWEGFERSRRLWIAARVLVAAYWLLPLGSILACPGDMHGSCEGPVALARVVSAVLVMPGMLAGWSVTALLTGASSGEVFWYGTLAGIVAWLLLLTFGTLALARRLDRRIWRDDGRS